MEQVAALAAENNLPIPTLALDTLQPTSSIFPSSYTSYRQNTMAAIRPPTFAPEDPWNAPRFPSDGGTVPALNQPRSLTTNGLTSTFAGSGLPSGWWNNQETVEVTILGKEGFILNRYIVYEITTEVRRCDSINWNPPSFYRMTASRSGSPPLLRIRVLMGLLGAEISLPSPACTSAQAGTA